MISILQTAQCQSITILHRCYISIFSFAAAVKVVQASELKFPLVEIQVIGEVECRKDGLEK